MSTKCLSCGYQHYETRLNCPKCGSFYTEVTTEQEQPLQPAQIKKIGMIDKIKHALENFIRPKE